MTRLIDADALIQIFEADEKALADREFQLAAIGAANTVRKMPTMDAVPVRHGKWKKTSCKWVTYECSECGERTDETIMGEPRYVYCPMCGARMVEDDQTD